MSHENVYKTVTQKKVYNKYDSKITINQKNNKLRSRKKETNKTKSYFITPQTNLTNEYMGIIYAIPIGYQIQVE